jgi:hypothetical protein
MKIEESDNNIPVNENKDITSNERKGSNAKGIWTTVIISFIILLATGIVFYSLYTREHKKQLSLMEEQKSSFTGQITARDSVINEWILTFDEIERNLAIIKEKEKVITLNSSDREFSKDKKEQILEDIKYINSLLDQNKKKIANLSAQLKKSGGTIKALQNKISELEATIKQSEIEISDLKTLLANKDFEIEQLNAQVTGMQTTIEQKDEKISTQTNEMNKAFIACGTYKELKVKGIVTKEGGFLGLGKKETLIENFPDSVFTQINITETKTIPVNSKNAKLITEHPSGSYEFIRDSNNTIEYIEIKDPIQFWKISRYAVVDITKIH